MPGFTGTHPPIYLYSPFLFTFFITVTLENIPLQPHHMGQHQHWMQAGISPCYMHHLSVRHVATYTSPHFYISKSNSASGPRRGRQ